MMSAEIDRPKISVVMTVYNAEKFLDEAIRSVLGQSFAEFEFIVVDDGSTDRSVDRVKAYTDRRMRFFPLVHSGRAASLNFAIAESTASFIAIMDADDIAYPQRLQSEFEAIARDPALDVVGSSYQVIDEQGDLVREKHLPMSHEAIVALMPVQCSVCFPAALIRKDIFLQAGPFNEKLTAAVDYEMWLRILDRAKFHNLPSILLKYRLSGTSISSRFRNVQAAQTYELSMRYLQEKYQNAQSEMSKASVTLQLGKLEYYYGTMVNARKYFSKLLWNNPDTFGAWRYYLASLFGSRIFRLIRSTKLSDTFGKIFKQSPGKNEYFMP